MKKKSIYLMMALLVVTAVTIMGCVKEYTMQVSTQNLWFGLEAGTQEIELTANCKWTISKNDDADWYTISTMSGKNDATLIITVEALEDADFREASFVINSPGGHESHTDTKSSILTIRLRDTPCIS